MARRIVAMSVALVLCLAVPRVADAQAGTSQSLCLPGIDLCTTFNGWSWSPASSPQFTTNFSFFGSGIPGFTPTFFAFTWQQRLSDTTAPFAEGFGTFPWTNPATGGVNFMNTGLNSAIFGTGSAWAFPTGVSPLDVDAANDLRKFTVQFNPDGGGNPIFRDCLVDQGPTVFMDGGLSLKAQFAGFALFQTPQTPDCDPFRTGVIPEPSTIILLATGLLAVGGAAARRRKNEELQV